MSGVTAFENPELARSNLAVGHEFFLQLSRHSLTPSYLSIAKNRVFQQNLWFFDNWAFFLGNYLFCDVTEINSFFLSFFKKTENFLDFPNEAKFKNHRSVKNSKQMVWFWTFFSIFWDPFFSPSQFPRDREKDNFISKKGLLEVIVLEFSP